MMELPDARLMTPRAPKDEKALIELSTKAGERIRTVAHDQRRHYDQFDAGTMVKLVKQDMQRARDLITEGFALEYGILLLLVESSDGKQREQLQAIAREVSEQMTKVLLHLERLNVGVQSMSASEEGVPRA